MKLGDNMAEQTIKERQRLRNMSYFIDATHDIIENEGFQAVSVRRVSEMAGFNTGTLYNYFKNLDHLIGYAGVKYLKDYYSVLDDYIKEADNAEVRYIKIWELFSLYSFARPRVWKALFFLTPNDDIKEIFDGYFEVYPSDFGIHTDDLIPMINAPSIYVRSRKCLEPVANAGIIPQECVDELNEMTVLVYRGLLETLITSHDPLDQKTEVDKFIQFVKKALDAYRL